MHHDTDNAPGQQGGGAWLDRVNDAYYDRMSERMGQRTRERINWMCSQCEGETVLDVGCSQGITSILLGREGFRAIGIDIMQEAVDYANRELEVESGEVRARISFKRMDLLSMPVEGGYDNVILGEVVEHQTSASRFLKVAQRHVAPGGRMVVTVPFGLHPFPDHKCTVYPRDIVDALDACDIDKVEVVNGYIRVVAVKSSEPTSVDRNLLLQITERGAEEAQALYFENVESSRKVETKRRELAEKLKQADEKARAFAKESAKELAKERNELAQLKSQLLLVRNEAVSATDEATKLRLAVEAASRKLEQASTASGAVVSELDVARRQLQALKASEDELRSSKVRLEAQLHAAREESALREKKALENGLSEKRRYERKIEQMTDYRRRLEHQHATVKSWLDEANGELSFVKESVSFQLGLALVAATRSLRDFIALPVRFGRLYASGLRRRRDRRSRPAPSAGAVGAKEEDPSQAFSEGLSARTAGRKADAGGQPQRPKSLKASDVVPVLLPANRVRMLPPADSDPVPVVVDGPFPERTADMRVAAIMDDFTRESFRRCCDLRQLTPANWREEIASFSPHIVFVESAWKGEGELWARKIYPLSDELREMLAAARQAGIPTVFWNKEDPVHFSVFLPTARLFDHVFTTDIDCIKAYRAELGHDRVHLLPFACEPRTHNPIQTRTREEGFCFAGSFYAKYPERQRDFTSIVDALRNVATVDIFDRNLGKDDPSLKFPDEYEPLIRGNLPYDQIDRAYKGYRYGININTVKQSQSMFARRAFDLLASNTVTVSNYSRGIRSMFGDLVVSSDHGGEVVRRLEPYLRDERAYRKLRLRGLRKVLSEHTYEDRMAFIVSKVSAREIPASLPEVCVTAVVNGHAQLEAVLSAYDRQDYRRRRLVVVVDGDVGPRTILGRDDIAVMQNDALSASVGAVTSGGFIAVFSADDYYGPAYLTDLALATRYADASVIGKGAHFAAGSSDVAMLVGDGAQYTPCEGGAVIQVERGIVRTDAVRDLSLAELLEGAGMAGLDALAIDEFNYCRGWSGDRCEIADDLQIDAGVDLARLQRIAETSHDDDATEGNGTAFSGFGAAELSSLFPDGEYAEGRVRLVRTEKGIEIASSLGTGKFAYVYANAPVPVEAIFPDDMGRFNMLVSSEILLSFTLIFLDGNHKRIGHVIRACNSNQSVVPVDGTKYLMLGFRIQDPGLATLDKLVLQHVPPDIDVIVGSARRLLVSRGYPSYDQLYSYAFVHHRVLGYRADGLDVDVFRFSDAPLSYGEFEGVDVVGGNVGDLSLMLRSNGYESILVHSFDEQVWSAVEPWLGSARVVVWVHGAEIQPWFRRDFNNASDAERRNAIHRSDMRLALWRRVLSEMPDNLHLVFVSEYLAREAMRDLGIEIPRDRYSVIHNHIDGEFFPSQQKDIAQRHRILSIRPYSKRTYANDLAVKAVLDLSHEPWFDQLQFSFFGDGPLFDETLAPLREGFPNVRIEKRFLTQSEIRALHEDHGVFLVPSRIDSQGISRDEAMASGLVPVTNRVSAIPEFVNDEVAFLADAEDWRGLADAIRALHADPDRFAAMSRNAARHVRSISGREATLEREIRLIRKGIGEAPAPAQTDESGRRRIAVYGDLNLNLLDGSAVWAASLVEVLAGLPDVEVDMFLKAKLSNTRVVAPLFALANVRLIEPGVTGEVPNYTPGEAIDRIVADDARHGYEAVVLRGFELCRIAAQDGRLAGRLWTYLTDIPQDDAGLDAGWRTELGRIATAARHVLCQTRSLQDLLEDTVPAARGKTRLLPPMIPEGHGGMRRLEAAASDGILRIVYAGKFAPLWGIREMLSVAERLHAAGIAFEMHVYGDKIHNPSDDPGFREEIGRRLQGTPGVIWHGGVTRETLYEALPTMHVGWAWRHPELENSTLELSTKLLEYGQCGLPAVMAPSRSNVEAFGEDYPLFAGDADAVVAMLGRMAPDDELLKAASARSAHVAERHGFRHVRDHWVAPLLDSIPGIRAPT